MTFSNQANTPPWKAAITSISRSPSTSSGNIIEEAFTIPAGATVTYDIAGTAVVKNANVEFNVNAHTCVDQEDVRMENNSAMISIPVVPLAGDINFDGQVSFDDFLILSANFGKDFVASPADGDLNDDKLVNFADFLILSVNFAPKSEQIESRPDEASVDVVLATLDAGDPGQLEKLGGEGLGLVFGRQRPKLAESMK